MLFISVPLAYNVLVPDDAGRDISTPLFAQFIVFQSVLFHEYEHETAVPKETNGEKDVIVVDETGVNMLTESWGLKAEEVYT